MFINIGKYCEREFSFSNNTSYKLGLNVLSIYLYIQVESQSERKNIIFVLYFNIACYSEIFYNEHRLMLKLEKINIKKYVKIFKIGYPEEFKKHASWN